MAKTYRDLFEWLIALGHYDVARTIVSDSQGARSAEPHPDAIEAGARVHERMGIIIMLDCVCDYLHDREANVASSEMVYSLFDAWTRMDCPGLVDPVVVDQLRKNQLFDQFSASMEQGGACK